jgi:hypothetical protein
MSAFSEAKKLYDGMDLEQIMAFCAHHGVVFADKEVFLCAYPTNSKLIETEYKKGVDKADTWYVYIAAGNLKKAFEVIRPLKYVAFRRFDKRFRIYEFERMRRLIWVKA